MTKGSIYLQNFKGEIQMNVFYVDVSTEVTRENRFIALSTAISRNYHHTTSFGFEEENHGRLIKALLFVAIFNQTEPTVFDKTNMSTKIIIVLYKNIMIVKDAPMNNGLPWHCKISLVWKQIPYLNSMRPSDSYASPN